MSLLTNKSAWRALFWLLWSFCTVLFLLPASDLPTVNVWDKAEHAGVFFLLMALAVPAYKNSVSQHWLAFLLVTYGLTIEIAQYFIPTRSFSLLDLLADAIGIASMLMAAYAVKRLAP